MGSPPASSSLRSDSAGITHGYRSRRRYAPVRRGCKAVPTQSCNHNSLLPLPLLLLLLLLLHPVGAEREQEQEQEQEREREREEEWFGISALASGEGAPYAGAVQWTLHTREEHMRDDIETASPQLATTLIVGLLTLLLGMLLGAASLVSQAVPVQGKGTDADAVPPGQLSHVPGASSGRTAWRAKEQAWQAGRLEMLVLNEAELNQWSAERLAPPKEEPDAQLPFWQSRLRVVLAPVNFRLVEDRLQLATQIELPGLFAGKKFHCELSGRLVATWEGLRFVPEQASIGQAPVGSVAALRKRLYGFLLDRYLRLEAVSWLPESFGGLESAQISAGQLVLRRQARG